MFPFRFPAPSFTWPKRANFANALGQRLARQREREHGVEAVEGSVQRNRVQV